MDREDIIARQQGKKKKTKTQKIRKSLMSEYLHYWYILILTVLMCYPGYACEVLFYNVMLINELSPFVAAIISIFVGGIISTLPFLILNIVLCVKKKKYYAIAFQVAVMEITGLAFFLYNQIQLTGV